MVQLTEGEGVDVHGALYDSAYDKAWYVQNNMLKCVDVNSFKEEDRLSIPKGFTNSQLSITKDSKFLAYTYREVLELCDRKKVQMGIRESYYRRPTSVVIRYDVEGDKYHAVWGEREWISHTNIHPYDPNIILYCHETSWHLVQRMWICKVATDEVYPLVVQKYNLDRVGHEFFTESGRVGTQFSCRHTPEVPFYQHGDVFVNVDGTNEIRYFYPYTRPDHIQLNYAENMGVGDTAHIRADQDDKRDYISLLKYDPETLKVKVGLLCRHGSSWADQKSHPHPLFTPDDRHVVYSSHTDGRCNVYMAEADWDRCILSEDCND
jgi:oligogalacturonide lyase